MTVYGQSLRYLTTMLLLHRLQNVELNGTDNE